MTTRVWLVRHGESLLNALGRVQGWADAPLTPAGVAHAAQRGREFTAAGVVFDAAVSADGVRHRETLRGLLGDSDVPVTEDVRWRELYFGRLEGGLARRLARLFAEHSETEDPVGAALEALAARPVKAGGEVAAESPAAVVARARAALDDAAALAPGGDVLVVTSGITMMLLVDALGGDLGHLAGGPPHLSVSLLVGGGGRWAVDAAVVARVPSLRPLMPQATQQSRLSDIVEGFQIASEYVPAEARYGTQRNAAQFCASHARRFKRGHGRTDGS